MSHRIDILPEHVANQIAAGEVVQRPASVIKELMENAVDAGAGSISVVTRDGGRTLMQVIDDGSGMPQGDAVRAFARHATSKIRKSEDLFTLRTFGFRGEALASIASVAEVELRTRPEGDELGTLVTIAGGTEADALCERVSAPKGTGITVRNLFFNTPARRKFLKSDTTETKQILTEFQRVVLCHPECAFTLVADDKTLLSLAPGSLHQRIVGLVGKRLGDQLLEVEVDTPIVRIKGYVGLPATAKKGGGEQFFFVNGRYFRSPYLQKAVMQGYNKLLPLGYVPSYFLYIHVDPARLDVNIHPQKTEVKFEDEQAMWQIIASAVARSLGKHNVVPMLDFENGAPGLQIPVYRKPGAAAGLSMSAGSRGGAGEAMASARPATPPDGGARTTGGARRTYDPFKTYDRQEWDPGGGAGQTQAASAFDAERVPFIERIPPGLLLDDPPQATEIAAENEDTVTIESALGSERIEPPKLSEHLEFQQVAFTESRCLAAAGGRYLLTTTADGVVVIDTARALLRITYEELLRKFGATENPDTGMAIGQRELFPEKIELSAADHFLLLEHAQELTAMGFDLRDMGGHTVVVYGLPVEMAGGVTPTSAVEELLVQLRAEGASLRDNHRERLAAALARSCCRWGAALKPLTPIEGDALVRRLFACEEPNYTPDGRAVLTIIGVAELEKRLKKR